MAVVRQSVELVAFGGLGVWGTHHLIRVMAWLHPDVVGDGCIPTA